MVGMATCCAEQAASVPPTRAHRVRMHTSTCIGNGELNGSAAKNVSVTTFRCDRSVANNGVTIITKLLSQEFNIHVIFINFTKILNCKNLELYSTITTKE